MKIQLQIAAPGGDERPMPRRTAQWDIEDADLAVEIIPEYGGVIEDFGEPEEGKPNRIRAGSGLQRILMVIVITACIGFLIVLVNGVATGEVTLKVFMDYVFYVLAAFGIAGFTKGLQRI